MDDFFFALLLDIHVTYIAHRERAMKFFFTPLPLRDSPLNFYFFWLLCLFFALTILMLVRQMNYLKDVEN